MVGGKGVLVMGLGFRHQFLRGGASIVAMSAAAAQGVWWVFMVLSVVGLGCMWALEPWGLKAAWMRL